MSYTKINEEELVRMYNDPDITLETMMRHFHVSSGTIYRHLKANGIKSNRKVSIPWTEEENQQLIAAREGSLTGAELYAKVPTRKPMAIKSRVQYLRARRIIPR